MSLEFTLPSDITLPEQPKRVPTASLKRRLLAAIATELSLSFLMAVPMLLDMILLLIVLNVVLSAADDLGAARNTVKSFENYELIIRFGLTLITNATKMPWMNCSWNRLIANRR